MNRRICVVVIDDHLVARKGVISLLEDSNRIQVVAEGSAGNHVLALMDLHKPDVLVTDLQMPAHEDEPKGPPFEPLSTLKQVLKKYPGTAVLVLTQDDDIQTIQSLAEMGVRGYMLKTDDFTAVLDQAVEMIHKGATYFSPEVKEVIFSAPRLTRKPQLTERQFQVLQAIIRSPEASREEIAEKLSISKNTLQKHVTATFTALGVTNMESCILRVMRMGLVDADGNAVWTPSDSS